MGSVLLIAHRGASAGAPENSIEAFVLALRSGADGIETDVRLTADGVAVLSHDDDLARTTGRSGAISQTPRVRLPPSVASLEELLSVAAGRARLYLELKVWTDDDGFHSASAVAEVIAPIVCDVPDVTVSSFDPAAVALARGLLPDAATALGVLEGADPAWAIEAAVIAGHDELHVHETAIDADLLGRARTAGLRVLGFTVNEATRLRELSILGAHGVFTDDPAGARRALTEH